MQNPLLEPWGRTALVALCALGPLVASGCKAKVSNRATDAGDPSPPVARKANASQLRRAVTDYLTANLKPTHRSGGEKLIALDRLKGQPRIVRDGPSVSFRCRAKVFVRTGSGEDQIRTEALSCSLAQGSAGWTVQVCKVGTTVVGKRSAEPPSDGGGSVDGIIGVPSCDRMLKFFRCYMNKLPKSTEAATKKSYRKIVESYRKMAANPGGRKAMAKSCKMAVKAMKKSAKTTPLFKGCI